MRTDLVAAARRYVGTPFRHQGRSLQGVDCVGVVICAARDAGFVDAEFDRRNYGRQPRPERMRALLAEQLELVPIREAQPGDVYRLHFDGLPRHLAVVTDVGILHAYEQVGRCVEHRLDDAWRARIVEAWRFPGLH